jgi:hypothetical protein
MIKFIKETQLTRPPGAARAKARNLPYAADDQPAALSPRNGDLDRRIPLRGVFRPAARIQQLLLQHHRNQADVFHSRQRGVCAAAALCAHRLFAGLWSRRRRVPPHPAALALCGLFVVSVGGALLSRYPDDVFWGQNNRYQGLLTLFAYALVVLVLSRRKVDLRWPERALALGAALVGLLGLLNHFGADPLGFTENLRKSDQGRFLSTIGNADFYGSYLVMAFPATLGVFLHAKTLRGGVLSGLALVCVSFGALVAGSDSAALGLFAGAVVFPLVLFTDTRAMRRLPLGWGIFFLCAFVFGLLSRRLPSATYLSYFTTLVSRPAVALPLAAVMLLLWRLPAAAGAAPNRKRAYGISLPPRWLWACSRWFCSIRR